MSDVPMGEGWWLADDGKWYAPELHPGRRHDALTDELPEAGPHGTPSAPRPPRRPPQPSGQQYLQSQNVTSAGVPAPPGPSHGSPQGSTSPPPPFDPNGSGGSGGSDGGANDHEMNHEVNNRVIWVLVALVVVVAGLVGVIAVTRSGSGEQAVTVIDTTTTTLRATTTTTSEFDPEPDDGFGDPDSTDDPRSPDDPLSPDGPATSTTTSRPPGTTVVPPPKTTEPKRSVMPDVVCMDLPAARRAIRDVGAYFPRAFDASGDGRVVIVEGNWIVVSQSPRAGGKVTQANAKLGVVKKDEPNPC